MIRSLCWRRVLRILQSVAELRIRCSAQRTLALWCLPRLKSQGHGSVLRLSRALTKRTLPDELGGASDCGRIINNRSRFCFNFKENFHLLVRRAAFAFVAAALKNEMLHALWSRSRPDYFPFSSQKLGRRVKRRRLVCRKTKTGQKKKWASNFVLPLLSPPRVTPSDAEAVSGRMRGTWSGATPLVVMLVLRMARCQDVPLVPGKTRFFFVIAVSLIHDADLLSVFIRWLVAFFSPTVWPFGAWHLNDAFFFPLITKWEQWW